MKNAKIHLIMPMAGGGTRFGNYGFNVPKPLIELQGKPFFFWATQSIVKYIDVQDITFVILQEHIDKFNIKDRILEYYPKAKFEVVPYVLNGAVLTCKEGIKNINDSNPILFNDCDHGFICTKFYEYCKAGEYENLDGALLTFKSNDPKYSFVEFDLNRNICRTVEKEAISDEAICGAYYFKNKNLFSSALEKYLLNCQYNEYFVSGLYNIMAENNNLIKSFQVDTHISFGTPDEYKKAIANPELEELL